MTAAAGTQSQSFVLLRLGERRFALSANDISSLVAPSRLFRFAHRTPEIDGVILRRGRIVPVCDVAARLIGKNLVSRRLYLIAQRHYNNQREWVAVPVTGECELINAEMMPPSPSDAPHVAGWLSHAGDVIEVLNLDYLTPGPVNSAPSDANYAWQEARP